MRTRPVAVDQLDRAAVCLHALGHDRKTDTGAADGPALQAPPLIERLENAVAVLRRDTRPGIGDLERELRIADFPADVDRAALGQELDRVGDEVLEHEAELSFIRAHANRIDVELELDLLIRDQKAMLA